MRSFRAQARYTSCFATGLFNGRTYGDQTQTVDRLRQMAKTGDGINIFFTGPKKEVPRYFSELKEAILNADPVPYSLWYGNHPLKLFVKPGAGNIVPPDDREKTIKAQNKMAFFGLDEYNAQLGYGYIYQHDHEETVRGTDHRK